MYLDILPCDSGFEEVVETNGKHLRDGMEVGILVSENNTTSVGNRRD